MMENTMLKHSKFSIFTTFEMDDMENVLTLYGKTDEGEVGCLIGCTVLR